MGILLFPYTSRRQNGQRGLLCLDPMQSFGEPQRLLDRGDCRRTTTVFFEVVRSVLAGVDALFQADQDIGEFFKLQLSEESMVVLYACFHDKSIEWRKNMACMQE